MEYPIVTLHCYMLLACQSPQHSSQWLILSMKPWLVVFKCLYWLPKQEIGQKLTFNIDLMQGSLKPP